MTFQYRKPIPKITKETGPFWEGCKHHKLMIQCCDDCGAFRFPPKTMCPKCNSINSNWSEVSGVGEIYSFTIVPRFAIQGFPMGTWAEDEYPILLVIIELAGTGKTRMVSNMIDCSPDDIRIGAQVKVVFEAITEEITLPRFKLL